MTDRVFLIERLLCCPLCRADITVMITGTSATSHYACPRCGQVFRIQAKVVLAAAEIVSPEFADFARSRRAQSQAAWQAAPPRQRQAASMARDGR